MGQAKVDEFNQASKGMALPQQAIANAAARVHAIRKAGGASEVRAQSRAMSKTKRRVRVRKAHPGFQNVAAGMAARQGIPMKNARAELAASTRRASPAAKAANPRLKRVSMGY